MSLNDEVRRLARRALPGTISEKEADWRDYAIPALGAAAGGLLGGPPGAVAGGAAGYGLTQLNKPQAPAAPKAPEVPKVEAPSAGNSIIGHSGTGGKVTSVEEAGGKMNSLLNLTGLGSKGDKTAMHPLMGALAGGAGGYAVGKLMGNRDPQQLALLGALGGGGLAHLRGGAAAGGQAVTGAAQQLIPRAENAAAQAAAADGRAALEAVGRRPPPTPTPAPSAAVAAAKAAPAAPAAPAVSPVTAWADEIRQTESSAAAAAQAAEKERALANVAARYQAKGLPQAAPPVPPPAAPAAPAAQPSGSSLGNLKRKRSRGSFGEDDGLSDKTGSMKLALDMSHPILGAVLRERLRTNV